MLKRRLNNASFLVGLKKGGVVLGLNVYACFTEDHVDYACDYTDSHDGPESDGGSTPTRSIYVNDGCHGCSGECAYEDAPENQTNQFAYHFWSGENAPSWYLNCST